MENSIYTSKLLKSLHKDEIASLISNGHFRIVTYNKDVILHFDGEPCKKAELILSGKVVIERIEESGGLLTVAEFINDDLLGGNLVFSKNPYYPMTVTTKSQCVILEISKDILFSLLARYPDFLKTYLVYISDHAYMLGDKIKHYVNRTIRESIVSFLRHEIKLQNSNKINLLITKKELAEKIGVQRTSLSRELTKMKKDGLIDYDKGTITILQTI